MTALPPPLTPPECDLQDFKFMPLHVARLRDSDLAAEAEPAACWYAVLLWAVSWHQIPAASLPDDDVKLTKLLGLGRDVRSFTKHKAAALRGFTKCSDGRLYHPVVAEAALEAWNGKLQQRWRTELARIKKHNQRTGEKLASPTFEEFLAGAVPVPRPEPVPGDGENCPPSGPSGNAIQGTGKGKGKGKGNKREESKDPSLSASAPKSTIPEGFPDATDIAEAVGWIANAGVTLDAEAHAKRFRSHAVSSGRTLVDWSAAWRGWIEIEIEKAPAAGAVIPAAEAPIIWNGPDEVWAACVVAMGEALTRSYLGRCTWQEVPQRAVVAPHAFAAGKLIAADLGVEIIVASGRAA